MAIIYSYPTVPPTADDLVLGTDVNQPDKPTKNFTIQSIVDIVAGGAAGLGAVLKISSNAQDLTDPSSPVNQPIQNLTFINGTGSATFSSFTDGSMTISSGVGVNFVSIQSVDFLGNLTGIVKVGSSIAGAADGDISNNVTAVTQPTGTNNTTIATTAFVQQETTLVDLDFSGTSESGTVTTGAVDLDLQTFSVVGTAANIETSASGQILTLKLTDDVTIADDLTVTDVLTVNGTTASNIIAGGLQVNNSGGAHTFRVKGQTNDNLINTNVGATDADDQVAIGKNAADAGTRLDVSGLIQGTSITSSGMLTAEAAFSLTGGINLPSGYGLVNQVLTNVANPGATTSLAWTTPTVGTLTDVDPGFGIAIDKTAPAEPIIAIDYLGTNNAIIKATAYDKAADPIIVAEDEIWFNDKNTNAGTPALINKIKKAKFSDLPFTPAVSGTQYDLAMFSNAAGTELGDSIISQDSGSSAATVTGTLDITSTGTASKFIVDTSEADADFQGTASEALELAVAGDISSVNDVISYPATSGTTKAQSGTGVAVEFQDGAGENNSIIYPVIGQVVTVGSGTGVIPAGTTVASVSGSTFTLSVATTTALAAGDTLNFAASTLDIYTSGGNVRMPSFIPSTIATSKYLTNLPTPTSSAITANDTILDGMAKLQGQISALPGALQYKGAWDASNGVGGSPNLQSGGLKVNGHFYIVSVDSPPAGTFPNGGSNPPSEWKVGDWCVFTDDGAGGAADVWQKIDNSSQVSGSGALNKVTKWTGPDTIGTGLITDNASIVTIGATGTGDFLVEGETTLGGGATNNTLVSGDLRVNKDFNLVEALGVWDGSAFNYGPISGTTKRVLTSGGAAGTAPTWEVPKVGTLTGITAGDGINVALNADADNVTVSVDYLGTDNAILSATDLSTGTIALTDQIWFNDIAVGAGSTTNTLSYAPVSKLKDIINTYSWDLDVNGGTAVTIADTNQVGFNNGDGIVQTISSKDVTTALRYVNATSPATEKNAIEAVATETAATGDFLWFSDTSPTNHVIKKATIADVVSLGDQDLTQVLAKGNDTGANIIEVNNVSGGIDFIDNAYLRIGTGNDLQIYHDGSVGSVGSVIKNTGTLPLNIWSDDTNTGVDFKIIGTGGSASYSQLKLVKGQGPELYHYRSSTSTQNLRLKTTDTGIQVIDSRTSVAPTILLQQDDGTGTGTVKSLTITQGITGASQILSPNSSLSLATSGGFQILDPAFGYFKASIGTNIEFNPANSAGTNTVQGLSIAKSTDATAAGTLTRVYGDLQVDGNINHGGGGGGTAKGGTFTKLFTSVAGGSVAFTIVRATSGAMVFDVMMTSDTSNACSIAKKFTVVKQFGVNPVVYKILDTGPDITVDFTPVFAQDTTDTSIKCTITPNNLDTQKIGITIDLGFGQNDATVVMNAT